MFYLFSKKSDCVSGKDLMRRVCIINITHRLLSFKSKQAIFIFLLEKIIYLKMFKEKIKAC